MTYTNWFTLIIYVPVPKFSSHYSTPRHSIKAYMELYILKDEYK